MKDLKVLSSGIHPGVGHESIHNVDSINTALLGIDIYNIIIDWYHPECAYILCLPDVTAYVLSHFMFCIVCKNLETEGSKRPRNHHLCSWSCDNKNPLVGVVTRPPL